MKWGMHPHFFIEPTFMTDALEQVVAARVESLGYELVELERGGSRARPLLRVRIDHPDSETGHGISVDDCAVVTRSLEQVLDGRADLGDRYVLEVSSPGLDRPLLTRRDFERFAGRQVSLKGTRPLLAENRRLEGELLGLVDEDGVELVRLRLAQGGEVAVPRSAIARAQLIFRWGD
jgi:ribosome maturation factor RimP